MYLREMINDRRCLVLSISFARASLNRACPASRAMKVGLAFEEGLVSYSIFLKYPLQGACLQHILPEEPASVQAQLSLNNSMITVKLRDVKFSRNLTSN